MEIYYPYPLKIQYLQKGELKDLAFATWEAVLVDWLLRLAYGMVRRLQMCLEAKGDTINY